MAVTYKTFLSIMLVWPRLQTSSRRKQNIVDLAVVKKAKTKSIDGLNINEPAVVDAKSVTVNAKPPVVDTESVAVVAESTVVYAESVTVVAEPAVVDAESVDIDAKPAVVVAEPV